MQGHDADSMGYGPEAAERPMEQVVAPEAVAAAVEARVGPLAEAMEGGSAEAGVVEYNDMCTALPCYVQSSFVRREKKHPQQ